MTVKTYDPGDVSIVVGAHIVEGYADGTFINVARNNEYWTLSTGADGQGTRSANRDKSGRITLTLQQSSPSNAYLSALAATDERNGGGVVPVLVRDSRGQDIHAAATAWIVKPADSEFGEEVSQREWIIETDSLEMVSAGLHGT